MIPCLSVSVSVCLCRISQKVIDRSEPFLRASAMLKHVIDIGWTSVRLSVCPSVCPSHAGTVSKRLNILS